MSAFDPGLPIWPAVGVSGFDFGSDCFITGIENRTLDEIRKSLSDPACDGPGIVYTIAMDVGKNIHRQILEELHLLYGVVTYSAGRLGMEPVRSQGHIHRKSTYANNWSTPEVYEIWSGEAVIYMQETARDDPGRCFAVYAKPGEVVIVPPGWAHATISANPEHPLTFGAWCDRDFGFEYDDVRAHGGLAWFPFLDADNIIWWEHNDAYSRSSELIIKGPRKYHEFEIQTQKSIYSQFEQHRQKFRFVPLPQTAKEKWIDFFP